MKTKTIKVKKQVVYLSITCEKCGFNFVLRSVHKKEDGSWELWEHIKSRYCPECGVNF